MNKLAELRAAFGETMKTIADLRGKVDPTDEDRAALDAAVTRGFDLKTQIQAAEAEEARVSELRDFAGSGDWVPAAAMAPHNDAKNTRDGVHRYDPAKAVREFFEGRLSGLEAETQQDARAARLARNMPSRGLHIPHDAPHKRAALTTTTGAGGISPQVYPTIFDALQSALVLSNLGVNVLSLDGPTKLPLANSATSYFVTEGNAPADGSPSLGALSLNLKTAAAKGSLTRQMIYSTNLNTQAFMVDYLIRAIALRIQIGFIAGTGAGGQPKGLTAYTDTVNLIDMTTNGSALTRAKLLAFVAPVADSNAAGEAKWLANSKTTSKLEATAAEAGYPVYLCDPVAKSIVGRPYLATDAVPSNLTAGSTANTSALAYGVWSETVLALFSGIDLTVGEVQDDGSIPVRVFQDMDCGILHGAAISVAVKGVVTT